MAIRPLKMYSIQEKLIFSNWKFFFLLGIIFTACTPAVNEAYLRSIAAERMQEQALFIDPVNSPLDSIERQSFTRLNYFPIDESFKVNAFVQRFEKTDTFSLPHSNEMSKPYKKYGMVHFQLKGKLFELMLLEPVKHKAGHENSLLLCFTDLSSGISTYPNGRYLDLEISNADSIELDFNKAYNPYCAYSKRYHCPIPPATNKLAIAVEAGMQYKAH